MRTFPHFKYRECDAFAEYLHQQSLKGWHFVEWRLGLVFEKGKPADIRYGVEIFPKGKEDALRPDEDTEEYAEYCAAAGWKMLDGERKFVIFRQEKEDAVPIVSARERLENVRKAEKQQNGWRTIFAVYLLVSTWLRFWKMDFDYLIFSDGLLLMNVFITIVCLYSIIDRIVFLYWIRKAEQKLDAGDTVVYGKKVRRRITWEYWIFLAAYAMMVFFERDELFTFVLPVTLTFGGILVIALITALWRPAAFENWLFQMMAIIGLFVVLTITYTVMVNGDGAMQFKSPEDIPLVKADYQEAAGQPEIIGEHAEGIMGTLYRVSLDYPEGDLLEYEVCESDYEWVIRHRWKEEFYSHPHEQDVSELWDAQEAWYYGNAEGDAYWYQVLYPNHMLVMWSDVELDAKQVQIIRGKLNLF